MSLTGRGKTTERHRFTLVPDRLSITHWVKEKRVSCCHNFLLLNPHPLNGIFIFFLSIFIDDLSFRHCDWALYEKGRCAKRKLLIFFWLVNKNLTLEAGKKSLRETSVSFHQGNAVGMLLLCTVCPVVGR
jgi:hypothetical protein